MDRTIGGAVDTGIGEGTDRGTEQRIERGAGPGAWAAAFLPGAPVLVPGLAGASDRDDLAVLRQSCADAVSWVLGPGPGWQAGRPRVVVCIGSGARTWRHESSAWGTVAGLGLDRATPVADPALPPTLPLALTLARLHLQTAGWTGPVIQQELAGRITAAGCSAVAAELPRSEAAWLVVADGSTARTPRAPTGLDPRAAGFDASVEHGLRSGRPAELLALDQDSAGELGATGWAPWRVMAEAAGRRSWGRDAESGEVGSRDAESGEVGSPEVGARLIYAQAPLGVGYLVGTWWSGATATGG